MISSLLHRLNLVEQTLNGNAQLLSELQLLEFEAGPCPRDVQRGRDLDTLRDFLRILEPHLAQSAIRLHGLSAAVIRQRAQMANLKSLSDAALSNVTRLVGATRPSVAPSVDAPPPDEATSNTARNFAHHGRLPSRRYSPTENISSTPSECVVADARCCHLANHRVNMYRTSLEGETQCGCTGVVRVSVAAGVDCAPREGGSSGGLSDAPDVVLELLEAEVQKQERMIQEMVHENEVLANKEQEYVRKNEWYEHKMRLLKQDKRRRGETIGKLLRCIDDMRETNGGGGGGIGGGGIGGGIGGGGITVTDETKYFTTMGDRDDQGSEVVGRGTREEARGGWTEEALRNVFQDVHDEERAGLRNNASAEFSRPNDLEADEDSSRLSLDPQRPNFVFRQFPSLSMTGSTGSDFILSGQDGSSSATYSRYRQELKPGQFPFAQ